MGPDMMAISTYMYKKYSSLCYHLSRLPIKTDPALMMPLGQRSTAPHGTPHHTTQKGS